MSHRNKNPLGLPFRFILQWGACRHLKVESPTLPPTLAWDQGKNSWLVRYSSGFRCYQRLLCLPPSPHQNVFSVSIGNLPARSDVLIKVTYVTELAVEGDQLAFHLLGCVAPWKRQEVLAKGVPGGGEAADVELETIHK